MAPTQTLDQLYPISYLLAINLSLQYMHDNDIQNANYFVPYLLPEKAGRSFGEKTGDIISKVNIQASSSKSSELEFCPGVALTKQPSLPGYLQSLKWQLTLGKKGFGKEGKKGGWFGSTLKSTRWKESELRDRALPVKRIKSFEPKQEERREPRSRPGLLENWPNFDETKNY